MNQHFNLQVLIPLVVAGAVASFEAWSARKRTERACVTTQGEAEIYRGPQGLLGVILFFSIVIPVGAFLLPDSVVLDARSLFNVSGVAVGTLFFWSWLYLKRYKITLNAHALTYGAFRLRTIDLNNVTLIHYHWVNNGISLKLFKGKKRIAIFEGNVEHFDAFAKSVRRRIPKDAIAETVGKASF